MGYGQINQNFQEEERNKKVGKSSIFTLNVKVTSWENPLSSFKATQCGLHRASPMCLRLAVKYLPLRQTFAQSLRYYLVASAALCNMSNMSEDTRLVLRTLAITLGGIILVSIMLRIIMLLYLHCCRKSKPEKKNPVIVPSKSEIKTISSNR